MRQFYSNMYFSASKIILNKLIEIPINNYVFNNPYLAVSICLCPLYIGNYNDVLKKNIESSSSTMKSILINVAGNLLMFQPDLESLLSIPEDLNKTKPVNKHQNIFIFDLILNLKKKVYILAADCDILVCWKPLGGDELELFNKQAHE
jgi:hypothetical protein